MSYTFKDLAIEVLTSSGQSLTVREIWEYAVAHHLAEKFMIRFYQKRKMITSILIKSML